MSDEIYDRMLKDLQGQDRPPCPSDMGHLKELADDLAAHRSRAEEAFNEDQDRIDRVVSQGSETLSRRPRSRRHWWIVPIAASVILGLFLWQVPKSRNREEHALADHDTSTTAWLFQLADESFKIESEPARNDVIQLDVTHLSAADGVQLVFVARQK